VDVRDLCVVVYLDRFCESDRFRVGPPCVPRGRDSRQEDVEKPFDTSIRRVTYPESYHQVYNVYYEKTLVPGFKWCPNRAGRSTPYTLHPLPYTLYPTPYTLHPTPCTLHPTPYTLHLTPYTLHPTPYTLHPASYILHPARAGVPPAGEAVYHRALGIVFL